LRPGRRAEPFGAGQRQARRVIAISDDKVTSRLPNLDNGRFESAGVAHIGGRRRD
jgi:hypothetical protein